MKTRREYLDGLRATIAKHGWAVQGVFAAEGQEGGSFSYTVGMTEAGLPELWVDSLDPRMAAGILNAVGQVQCSRGVALDGEVDAGYSVPFRVRGPVDNEAAEAFTALAMYPHPQIVEVRQVLFPDAAGRFPDEDGYDAEALPQRVLPLRGEES
jgi:hypothetical protein